MKIDRTIKSYLAHWANLADLANKTNKPHKPYNNMQWLLFAVLAMVCSCAKMGQPDGGWYDETPPAIVRTSPADQGVNIKAKKINIYFNEYIQVDNPTEKVVISPPQIEQAEIKPSGKKIEVELKDSLKPNTTYTIDFSDAISDNNENNPWATIRSHSPPATISTPCR